MKRHNFLSGIGIASALLSSSISAAAEPNPASTPAMDTSSAIIIINAKRLESLKYVVANSPSTGRLTSWIPALNAADVLTSAGMQAHWIPGVNELELSMPQGWTMPKTFHRLPYRKSRSNQVVVIHKATSVAYAPTLPVSDMPGSVCVPVSTLMSVLKRLGISSTWKPGSWDLSGHVEMAKSIPLSSGSLSSFQMTLSNQNPVSTELPPSPVPPAAPVTVVLPVNTGFGPTDMAFSMADNSIGMEDYVQSGKAEYLATGSVSSVEAWFKTAFEARGFKQTGGGASADYHTGAYSESIHFAPKSEPLTRQLQVNVSFKAVNPSETLVEYWVTDLVLPPRPKSSIIEGNVSSIDVTLKHNDKTTATATITDSTSIESVVNTINALRLISPPGVSSGPNITEWDAVTMVFHLKDETTVTVTSSKMNNQIYGAVIVGDVPLQDAKGTVWTAMESALQH